MYPGPERAQGCSAQLPAGARLGLAQDALLLRHGTRGRLEANFLRCFARFDERTQSLVEAHRVFLRGIKGVLAPESGNQINEPQNGGYGEDNSPAQEVTVHDLHGTS